MLYPNDTEETSEVRGEIQQVGVQRLVCYSSPANGVGGAVISLFRIRRVCAGSEITRSVRGGRDSAVVGNIGMRDGKQVCVCVCAWGGAAKVINGHCERLATKRAQKMSLHFSAFRV